MKQIDPRTKMDLLERLKVTQMDFKEVVAYFKKQQKEREKGVEGND